MDLNHSTHGPQLRAYPHWHAADLLLTRLIATRVCRSACAPFRAKSSLVNLYDFEPAAQPWH